MEKDIRRYVRGASIGTATFGLLVLICAVFLAAPAAAVFTDGFSTATATDLTPDNVAQGAGNVSILELTVNEGKGVADEIWEIAVQSNNTNDADVIYVYLYLDDLDGIFNPTLDLVVGESSGFVGGWIFFNALNPSPGPNDYLDDGVGAAGIDIAAGGSVTLFLAYDIAAGAVDGNQFDARMPAFPAGWIIL